MHELHRRFEPCNQLSSGDRLEWLQELALAVV